MLSWLVILAIILTAGLMMVGLSGGAIADGAMPFEVKLRQSVLRPISQVSYDTLLGQPNAISMLQTNIEQYKDACTFRPVNDFNRDRFTVHVPFSEHLGSFGRVLSYVQLRILALKIEYVDGKVEYRVVEIPDGRERRKLDVQLQ
jgi:hypothetical protein